MTRCCDDRGSALMLFPAGVFVVLVLAAISADLALVHHGHHQALDAATAAADDALMAGVDTDALRSGGAWSVSPAAASRIAHDTVARRGLGDRLVALDVAVAPDSTQLTVVVSLRVDYVFARSLPGGGSTVVTATGTAVALRR